MGSEGIRAALNKFPDLGSHWKTATPRWKRDIMVSKPALSAPIIPSRDEPVAVIGVSCRLPGVAGPEAFWRSLRQGGSAIAERPADRDDKASDAGFFGISPEEASAMDPQQRLALELAWEALEDAGITNRALRGSRTGVYVGAMAGDYATLAARLGADHIGPYSLTGTARGLIANRVSYALGAESVVVSCPVWMSSTQGSSVSRPRK